MTRAASVPLLAPVLLIATGCVPPTYQTGGGGTPPPPPAQLGLTGVGQALSRLTSDPSVEGQPALSPDGKMLLMVSQVDILENGQPTGRRESVIVGISPAGGGRTVYTSNRFHSNGPSWVPGTGSFVFTSDQMGKPAVVKALSSSPNPAIAMVVSGDMAPDLGSPRVSPDGKRVCFHMRVNGADMVGTAGIDGSNFTMLTEGAIASFSPDGSRILFHRRVGGIDQLFTVDAATGGGLVQLTNDNAAHAWGSWSPDGQYILFSSNLGWDKYGAAGSAAGTYNLFTIRADGTGLTQLTTGPRTATEAHWGADGWIYFASNESGNWDVWRFQPTLTTAAAP